MLVLHVGIHRWVGKICALAYLTLEIPRLVLSPLPMQPWLLPLILPSLIILAIVHGHILVTIIFDHVGIHRLSCIH